MKVVFVLSNFKWGGAERQAMLLARCLKAKGIEVAIFALETAPARVDQICREHQIEYGCYPFQGRRRFPRFVLSAIGVARAVRRLKPEVLLPYTILPNVVCGLIWRFTGAKICIWNQRNAAAEPQRVPWRWLEALAIRNVSHFCSNSNAGATFLQDELGVPLEHISVICNGVSLDPAQKSPKDWRSELRLSPGALAGCMVANIQILKDHATLLRAWKIVKEHFAQMGRCAVLLLAGRIGSTYDELVELSRQLELGDSVLFLGEIADVSGLLHAVDLGVFSSHPNEGTPNGVLESMAAGLPVIATDLPGVREALGNENQCFLCKPKDVDDLARKIIGLCGNTARMKEVGEHNKRRILQQFSMDSLTTKSVEMIQAVLKESDQARSPRS